MVDESRRATEPTRDGLVGDQALLVPVYAATDDELAEMVSRYAGTVREVAKLEERELNVAPATSAKDR